ncbi:hypothetical protein RJ640_011207 [Escallonia rubra]|uniref:Uncharacterized protein n=1 Tax=Escallonia rubra TaxID=112253 RepID=A0AA88RR45_9ASTE|nr:hypothetical protein RJ640_011207 [Escallonia rubra]
MGRGKIEIKKIENPTNRQVTYSKRRNGIFKKAQELTVLCDAKVSVMMYSKTGKFHNYTSPTTTTKKILDEYQKTLGCDIWSTHYERMQENLKQLTEINSNLKRDIRQRVGEDLNDLSIDELYALEQKMDASIAIVRERKYHKLKTTTGTCHKKVKSLQERNRCLLLEFEARCELDPQYGVVDNEGDYNSTVAFANGVSNLYAFRLHQSHPNLHDEGGFGMNDLRLA